MAAWAVETDEAKAFEYNQAAMRIAVRIYQEYLYTTSIASGLTQAT